MVRIRPLSLVLALSLGMTSAATFAATDTSGSTTGDHSHSTTDKDTQGKVPGHGTSVNNPAATKDNDSSGTGTGAQGADAPVSAPGGTVGTQDEEDDR